MSKASGHSLVFLLATRNEEDNLRKALPEWAKIIDGYVIGVEHDNKDKTRDVIRQELRGIPGEVITVWFDGLGELYTQLIKRAAYLFPNVHFALRSDASFYPLVDTFFKEDFDPECLEILLQVKETDTNMFKKINYINRNLPQARWTGSFHEQYRTPTLGDDRYKRFPRGSRCTTRFTVEESTKKGHNARMGRKQRSTRYIDHLKQDLEESMWLRQHTLFYLGLEYFTRGFPPGSFIESQEQVEDLKASAYYWNQLWDLGVRNGIAEIHMVNVYFHLQDMPASLLHTERSCEVGRTGEALFYFGRSAFWAAWPLDAILPFTNAAVHVPRDPEAYVWTQLYDCVARLAHARIIERCWHMDDNSRMCYCATCTKKNLNHLVKLIQEPRALRCRYDAIQDKEQNTDDVVHRMTRSVKQMIEDLPKRHKSMPKALRDELSRTSSDGVDKSKGWESADPFRQIKILRQHLSWVEQLFSSSSVPSPPRQQLASPQGHSDLYEEETLIEDEDEDEDEDVVVPPDQPAGKPLGRFSDTSVSLASKKRCVAVPAEAEEQLRSRASVSQKLCRDGLAEGCGNLGVVHLGLGNMGTQDNAVRHYGLAYKAFQKARKMTPSNNRESIQWIKQNMDAMRRNCGIREVKIDEGGLDRQRDDVLMHFLCED